MNDAEWILACVESMMPTAMYRAVGMDVESPFLPIEVEAEIANTWAEK